MKKGGARGEMKHLFTLKSEIPVDSRYDAKRHGSSRDSSRWTRIRSDRAIRLIPAMDGQKKKKKKKKEK